MTANITLIVVMGSLISAGVYLLLERSLTRVLLGLILLGNGANLLFLVAGGRGGGAPIVGITDIDEMSDPLPQALALTAIVITLGMVAFLLAMAHRSWQLNGNDEVQDDFEDRRIVARAQRNDATNFDTDEADNDPDPASDFDTGDFDTGDEDTGDEGNPVENDERDSERGLG